MNPVAKLGIGGLATIALFALSAAPAIALCVPGVGVDGVYIDLQICI